MKNLFVKIAAAGVLMLAPAIAQAAEGYSTANVNMRAGPSTRYPAVAVIPAGSSVEIRGCLSDVNWCDVEFYGGRGWVSGQYVQALYQQRRVYVGPQYYRPLGIPMIRFSVDNYWDRYYRNRDFYRERDRWSRGPDYYYRDRDNRDRDRDGRDRDRDWRDDNQRGDRQRGDLQRGDRQGDDRRGDDRRPDRRDFDCRPGDPSCGE
ncbi:SH3 domain-containing protein [Rhizobium leguminosarum]|uniref:SH3 domain-containing protein n=1 Tax=Rhizobium TaxID=379 RepID=UPI001C92273D|nr:MULTISPECIES: SH3 domain-containing protein [Rhizobium]MBY3050697.1 SH3 domain-containing protein [Rhizobium laguerreae]MBY5544383.1 SH3 domain-containing protein [Rhizobium leguminosarum]